MVLEILETDCEFHVRTYRLSLLVTVQRRPGGKPFGVAEGQPFGASQGKRVGRGLVGNAASGAG